MKDKNGVTLLRGDKIKVTLEGTFFGNSIYPYKFRFAYPGQSDSQHSLWTEGSVVEKIVPPHSDGYYLSPTGGLCQKTGNILTDVRSGNRYSIDLIDNGKYVQLVPAK
jgi:hypothetical protein